MAITERLVEEGFEIERLGFGMYERISEESWS